MIALGVSALPFDDPAGFTAPPAFGPFRVLHQIGSGVLGPVFRTFDPRHDKLVAVKVFRLDVVPEMSARLADELRRLAATPVDHPAVVSAIEAGLEGTTAFLAMEYVAAETLDVSLRRLTPASAETVVPLLRKVAEALEAAWARGLGHGSLHPRDIFVPSTMGDPLEEADGVRVAGFGVTAALEKLKITVPVRRPYAAPEREHGGPWDMRADVYSLGVIAHELLTGERPVGSLEENADGAQSDLEPGIRRALAGALAVDATYRFQTPTAFVDALGMGEVPGVAHSPAPVALPFESDRTDEADPQFDVEPELEPEPEPEPEPEEKLKPEPEQFVAGPKVERARMWPPAGTEVGSLDPAPAYEDEPRPADSQDTWRVTPEPKEDEMPRVLGFVLLAMGLVVGTAFGYWLRGPSTNSPVDLNPTEVQVTKVPEEEPLGTEVPVKPSATPTPTSTAAPTATPTAAPTRPTPPPATPRPTPAPAVPEPAANRGRLLVRSVPSGATVTVNGRGRGTTPATIRDLPFGSYTITVSRPGYQSREQKIAVSASVPARDLTLELTPVRAAAPPASGATTGTLDVVSNPAGATVAIDGRVVGTAPMRVLELSPGSHTVRLSLAGHRTLETKVVIRAGQQTPLRVSLEIQ